MVVTSSRFMVLQIVGLWEKFDKWFKEKGASAFIVMVILALLFYLVYQVNSNRQLIQSQLNNHIPTQINNVKKELSDDIRRVRSDIKNDFKSDIKDIKDGQKNIIDRIDRLI